MVSVFEKGGSHDQCDKCGLEGAGEGIPDVYLHRAGQRFQNLCDANGVPYEIHSKRHKKEIMDKLGVSEAAGTVNGAPYGSKSWIEGSRDYRRKQFAKDKPMIEKTFREWKEKASAQH